MVSGEWETPCHGGGKKISAMPRSSRDETRPILTACVFTVFPTAHLSVIRASDCVPHSKTDVNISRTCIVLVAQA